MWGTSLNKTMMTKKNVLFAGICGFFLFLIVIFSSKIGLCDPYNGACTDEYDSLSEIFQIFIPVLLFSLITYKLRDEVFDTWVKFVMWWVLGTFILVLIVPAQDSSLLPITKEIVSLFSTVVFTLVSLIVIIATSISLKGKK